MRTHAVGITNRAVVRKEKDAVSGFRATEWGALGSGLADSWGAHHFILTAEHVLERAQISDLSSFRSSDSFFGAGSRIVARKERHCFKLASVMLVPL